MARYKGFDTSKNKLQTIWEETQKNSNNLNILPGISLDYRSINFNKTIVTIPILTNKLISTSLTNVLTITLNNYPEWVINMIEPTIVYYLEDGFYPLLINSSLGEANSQGKLRNDDVSISSQKLKYWFTRIDNSHYQLKLFYTLRVLQAIKALGQGGFSSKFVPVFANMSLKILNSRIYETMNEKFE